MLTTTQKFPMIALAGAISFLATLAAFTAMTSPARGLSTVRHAPYQPSKAGLRGPL
jgi:hypothetical protein